MVVQQESLMLAHASVPDARTRSEGAAQIWMEQLVWHRKGLRGGADGRW